MEEFKLSARSHFDFSGLGELKARAQNKDGKVASEVGSQFEALFVQMMLKSMREAAVPLKSGLLDSSATDTFEEMYHGELSQEIAKRSSLGIADWILSSIQNNSSEGKNASYKNLTASAKSYQETQETNSATKREIEL